jgi:hypothetical protein
MSSVLASHASQMISLIEISCHRTIFELVGISSCENPSPSAGSQRNSTSPNDILRRSLAASRILYGMTSSGLPISHHLSTNCLSLEARTDRGLDEGILQRLGGREIGGRLVIAHPIGLSA